MEKMADYFTDQKQTEKDEIIIHMFNQIIEYIKDMELRIEKLDLRLRDLEKSKLET